MSPSVARSGHVLAGGVVARLEQVGGLAEQLDLGRVEVIAHRTHLAAVGSWCRPPVRDPVTALTAGVR
jgi:hypothetical protein